MDEYGDIGAEDLSRLQNYVQGEIEKLTDLVSELYKKIDLLSFYEAQVIKHAEKDSAQEKQYGIGAVQVRIPRFYIEEEQNFWVKPHFIIPGRFIIPPIDTWVKVVFREGVINYPEYMHACMPENDPNLYYPDDNNIAQSVGFVLEDGEDEQEVRFGKRWNAVRTNPTTHQILDSNNKYIIGFTDTAPEKLDIRVADGMEIHITTGNDGKIVIGNYEPVTAEAVDDKTTLEVKLGTNGEETINTKLYTLNATDAVIIKGETVTIGGGQSVSGAEKMILGETLKAKLDTILDKIIAHVHPSGVGPTGSATNAADFTTIKSELSAILSPKVKNN